MNERIIDSRGRRRLADSELLPYRHWIDDSVLFDGWLRVDDPRTLDEYVEDQKFALSSILTAPTYS